MFRFGIVPITLFGLDDPVEFRKVYLERKRLALEHQEDATLERLAVREEIQLRKAKHLKRGYENEEF